MPQPVAVSEGAGSIARADLAAVVAADLVEAGSPAVVVFTEAAADFMAVVAEVSVVVDPKRRTGNGSWHKRRGLC